MKYTKCIMAAALTLFFTSTLTAQTTVAGKEAPKKTEESANANEIVWFKYDDGLAKAKEEGKHVLIDFTAKWCGWCRKMERSTFVDPRVIKMINDNFVAVRVDGDSKDELDIDGYRITERDLTKREYGVTGYPAFWFLKPDGTKIGKINGYRDADPFLDALAFVNDKKYEPDNNAEPSAPDSANN